MNDSVVTSIKAETQLVSDFAESKSNNSLDATYFPPKRQVVRWTDSSGSLSTAALAHLLYTQPKQCIFVTANSESARNVQEELEFFGRGLRVLGFPDHETLPYDNFSPQADIVSRRLSTLSQLPSMSDGTIVVPIRTLLQKIPPKEYVLTRTVELNVGGTLDSNTYKKHLAQRGYRRVDTVFEHGEYAVRGSIIDLFPNGSTQPIRIDLFDNEIESLRIFDPDTQRTVERTDSVQILPAHEYPLDDESIVRFRNAWSKRFDSKTRQSPTYQDISDGRPVEGVECYLPLFYESTCSLLDYINADDAVVVIDQGVVKEAEAFLADVRERFEVHQFDQERPPLQPFEIYHRLDEIQHQWNQLPRIQIHTDNDSPRHAFSLNGRELPDLRLENRRSDPVRRIRTFLSNVDQPVLITAESNGRLQHLMEVLGRAHIVPRVTESYTDFVTGAFELATTVSPLSRGYWDEQRVVLSETQLFGSRQETEQQRARRKTVEPELIVRNLAELSVGAPVVHVDHGVGRYRGLETLTLRGQETEFVVLEYADGDKLYVPVGSLDLVSRYSGADDENAPLHKLGTDAWAKAKSAAARRIHDVATELLSIYARRKATKSIVLPEPDDDYESFCDQCDFELTIDQATATESVLEDLAKSEATDRLICGDVGFGKTEVAMRAAFHAVQSGHQVVLLVPTTILAQQHYETFFDRFSNWPVLIEVLSRFRSANEALEVCTKFSDRKIDVLIGTHKILHSNIDLSNLGLLIVDEEHRFGVRDKERIRNMRASVNTLSLTATPIPRTLNMSMGGLRDLSIIATPPAKRLSVKTFVVTYDSVVVKEAIQRELARGGQVFYLHNDVRTMDNAFESLRKLVPEARIGMGHGQMRKLELERVMSDFYHRRCNVLLCSTIIESGLDIPNANTIIVERADKFGLAQLHQLRGRVGRSTRQAYAYLLTPDQAAITVDARKRLDAIESSGELGSGFTLAVHDLEIRGAGELLGKEQSGQLETIGFTLYMSMLSRTIATLKSGVVPNFDEPLPMVQEINLNVSALIPDTYLPDIHNRLVTYRKISAAGSQDVLDDLKVDLIDRCGPLPDITSNLFRLASVKLRAREIGVGKFVLGDNGGRIEFTDPNRINIGAVVSLVQDYPNDFQVSANHSIRVLNCPLDIEARFDFADNLVGRLQRAGTETLNA